MNPLKITLLSAAFLISSTVFSAGEASPASGSPTDLAEDECPICMTAPTGTNDFITMPCCNNKLCMECLGRLETNYPRGDFYHERG